MQTLLSETQGQVDFRHGNGEISKVRIEAVGLGMRKVRVANLPPEVADRTLTVAISTYGEIHNIQTETWSNAYRYPMANGIRVINMTLSRHILSTLVVAGYRTLISYEGQPITCYGCNESGHMYTTCPNRRRVRVEDRLEHVKTWAAVAAKGPSIYFPTTSATETEVTDVECMDTETMKTTDSIQEQQREMNKQREKGEVQMPDHIEAQENDNMKEEGKRRVHSNTPTHLHKEGMEVRTDTQEEPQQERRRFGGDGKRWDSEETAVADDNDLERKKSGNAEGHSASGEIMNAEAKPTSPKKTKKLKTEREENAPARRRRSRSRTGGTTPH
jgi:hypothetical protein